MTFTIPETVRFSDLRLSRTPAGEVEFSWEPVEAICAASGIDISVFRDQHEDNVAALLTAWYAEARQRGEPPDAAMENLISEGISELN